MNIQVDGHTIRRVFGSYKATIGNKTHETNNFELMLRWVAKEVKELEQEGRFKRVLEVMPEDQYQALLKKDDSEHHDYSGIEHQEQLIKYEI